ncbi:hypothetical protein BU15DRAFT_76137 [Melanogaster broomeanus]|nr:hypothetical protein BU15DRAFT_76137 [Melanogaster broomeanus]
MPHHIPLIKTSAIGSPILYRKFWYNYFLTIASLYITISAIIVKGLVYWQGKTKRGNDAKQPIEQNDKRHEKQAVRKVARKAELRNGLPLRGTRAALERGRAALAAQEQELLRVMEEACGAVTKMESAYAASPSSVGVVKSKRMTDKYWLADIWPSERGYYAVEKRTGAETPGL